MQRKNTLAVALSLFATTLIAACSSTPAAPQQAEIHQEVEVTATVRAIDRVSRTISLERPSGERSVVVAGPEVRNFDQIDVGDTAKARYIESLSARLLGPDEADTELTVTVAAVRAGIGQEPAGGLAGEVAQTVQIESVDLDHYLVTFSDSAGSLHAVRAEREEGRRFVSGLKRGDHVELIYGTAIVLTVE